MNRHRSGATLHRCIVWLVASGSVLGDAKQWIRRRECHSNRIELPVMWHWNGAPNANWRAHSWAWGPASHVALHWIKVRWMNTVVWMRKESCTDNRRDLCRQPVEPHSKRSLWTRWIGSNQIQARVCAPKRDMADWWMMRRPSSRWGHSMLAIPCCIQSKSKSKSKSMPLSVSIAVSLLLHSLLFTWVSSFPVPKLVKEVKLEGQFGAYNKVWTHL